METKNSMTNEELRDELDAIFKALILKYVKLDLIDASDSQDLYVSCPTFEMDGVGIIGVPYIYSDHTKNKIYITYEKMRRYGLVKSELIYHARQNTIKVLNKLFKCDTEVCIAPTIDDGIGFKTSSMVNLKDLNESLLKGEIDG